MFQPLADDPLFEAVFRVRANLVQLSDRHVVRFGDLCGGEARVGQVAPGIGANPGQQDVGRHDGAVAVVAARDNSRPRINSMPARPDGAAAGSALSASASAVSWAM
ncbi:hypothetical protein [Nocardia abscessus]|uniref:hypothetical protein n=1 Tax=Nocardia abscessus TaxID=120957 RepID=UPI00245563E2|nr:hypothetical protein [Nocardia abscessus]